MLRMSRSSSFPREYAAVRPTATPSTTPIAVERPERTRTETPPERKRLSTSRPRSSVPNHASLDGRRERELPLDALVGLVRGDERPDERDADDEQRDAEPDLRPMLRPRGRDEEAPRAPRLRLEVDRDRLDDGDVAHGSCLEETSAAAG